jgi:hypothetical protein
MRRKMAFLLLILACSLMGCYEIFEDSAEFKRGRETKAMSLLKKYQTGASILQAETGRYPSLEELYEDGDYIGIISDAFYNAWDGLELSAMHFTMPGMGLINPSRSAVIYIPPSTPMPMARHWIVCSMPDCAPTQPNRVRPAI